MSQLTEAVEACFNDMNAEILKGVRHAAEVERLKAQRLTLVSLLSSLAVRSEMLLRLANLDGMPTCAGNTEADIREARALIKSIQSELFPPAKNLCGHADTLHATSSEGGLSMGCNPTLAKGGKI